MLANPKTRRRVLAGLAAAPAALTALRGVRFAAATDYGATPSVPADQGLQRLLAGNQRFVAGQLSAFGQLAHDRAQLVPGQSPFAVIVSCSDSRVPPELVFDQPLGTLFVIRTAGQVLDEAALSSIVYGIDALKAPLLVVLGHAGCGAVEAAVAALQGQAIPGYAYRFAEAIGPAVQSVLHQPGDLLENAVRANIQQGVNQLKAAQPELAAAVAGGRLTVTGASYDLASGKVSVLS
jgi:carbonic anhydrase